MATQAATTLAILALSLAALTGACTSPQSAATGSTPTPPEAASSPELACPWVDSERYRAPVKLANLASPPVSPFVPGCAIIRFKVAADGSVYKPALRAASPLNDGPTALAVLQTLRFQPARAPKTQFVLRLSMQRDSAGRISITTETRPGGGMFGGEGFFF